MIARAYNGASFERILNLSPGLLGESLRAGDVFKEDVVVDNSLGDAYFLDVYDLNGNGCEWHVISDDPGGMTVANRLYKQWSLLVAW